MHKLKKKHKKIFKEYNKRKNDIYVIDFEDYL